MFSQPEIERILEVFIYKQNQLQTYDPKYFNYVDKMKKVNLFSIIDQDMDIIRDFLLKWGLMVRTGIKPNIPKTKPIIQQYAQFLQMAQKQNLHTSNLQPNKQTIQDLFEALCSLVRHISAAKTLHLICPGFFPLWDLDIITRYNSSHKAMHRSPLIQMVPIPNSKGSKRATGKGYYDFMEFTRSFINKYHYKLSQIQGTLKNANPSKREKTLVKIADEFNMFATKFPFCYLV